MARRTIVVGAGRDDRARDALALAGSLAPLEDARLVLAGVYRSALVGDGLLDAVLHEERTDELERLRAALPDPGGAELRVLGSSSTVRGLHAVVEETGAGLLVLGHSTLGDVARALRGDIALGAIQAAPCAVAVAPAGYADRDGAGAAVQVVGAAFDGSPESEAALAEAARLAHAAGAALRVIGVLEAPYVFADPPVVDAAGVQHHLRALAGEVRAALDAAAARAGDGLAVSTAMPEGDAAA